MKKILKAYTIGSYRETKFNENCRKEDEIFHNTHRPSVGTGATGANAPINFEQGVPGTRPETEIDG